VFPGDRVLGIPGQPGPVLLGVRRLQLKLPQLGDYYGQF
jgi:hypothetical protein